MSSIPVWLSVADYMTPVSGVPDDATCAANTKGLAAAIAAVQASAGWRCPLLSARALAHQEGGETSFFSFDAKRRLQPGPRFFTCLTSFPRRRLPSTAYLLTLLLLKFLLILALSTCLWRKYEPRK